MEAGTDNLDGQLASHRVLSGVGVDIFAAVVHSLEHP